MNSQNHNHTSTNQSSPLDSTMWPAQQFPSKFSQLPGIGSPTPTADNQLMPYSGNAASKSHMHPQPGGPRNAWDGLEPEERLRQLESRVNVSERSNRALLEEVVRLQGELKAAARRSDETLRDERQARGQLENTLRSSADLLTQMSTRLQRTEDKVSEERAAVATLMNHTKSVEQAVLGSQQEMLNHRDLQGNKVQELRSEVAEAGRAKEQLERVTYQLVDEVRGIKSKLESELMDSKASINDLKNKAKKLEDESRQTRMESMRKTGETQSSTEQVTGQLRSQVEQRLGELRDVLVDLRTKTDQEVQDRRMLEQQVTLKMSDMGAAVSEQNRRREEALHALEVMQREKEHAAETERLRLQGKIAEIAEEVSKKILQKEMKLREESIGKFSELEQAIMAEQVARQAFERQQSESAEKQMDSMKKVNNDEINTIRDAQKADRNKTNDKMHKLNDALQLVERQLTEVKKQSDKVLAAEIKARGHHDKDTKQRIDDLQEKLQVATSTLQQAIGGINSHMQSANDKLKRDVKRDLEDNLAAEVRRMSDMDARISALSRKITSVEDMLEAKMNAASSVLLQSLREKMEGVLAWQDQSAQNMRHVQKELKDIPEDIYELQEKTKVLKSDLDSRVRSESEARNRDIDILKREMALFDNGGGGGGEGDMEVCNQSIRRLAESIQTVKTVLGMKIQSEQKLRESTLDDIQEQVDELNEKLKKRDDDKDKTDDDKNDKDKQPDESDTDKDADDKTDKDKDTEESDADKDKDDAEKDKDDKDDKKPLSGKGAHK